MSEPPALDLEAEEAYRTAWAQWRVSIGSRRIALEKVMDALQPSIAPGPKHPRWEFFAASLPGYNDWWCTTATRVCDALTSYTPRKRRS